MQSHRYDFTSGRALRACLLPLLPVAAFALIMHAGSALNLWPASRPTDDTDQTILVHKADMTRQAYSAELVLLGDSSCLMGVNMHVLSEVVGHESLNLGTLSFLDLGTMAGMLEKYLNQNRDRVRVVVVLLNPEALRRRSAERYHQDFLASYYAGRDFCATEKPFDYLYCHLGFEKFRSRILNRLLPAPLPGDYGRFYGFNVNLEEYLAREKGGAVDPGFASFKGDAHYRLSDKLPAASASVKAVIPNSAKLVAGITPIPQGYAVSNFTDTRNRFLDQWGQWLSADAVLRELPATLPDNNFARVAHLNAVGRSHFARLLGEELKALNFLTTATNDLPGLGKSERP